MEAMTEPRNLRGIEDDFNRLLSRMDVANEHQYGVGADVDDGEAVIMLFWGWRFTGHV